MTFEIETMGGWMPLPVRTDDELSAWHRARCRRGYVTLHPDRAGRILRDADGHVVGIVRIV